jgi:II/X family phage/plasmid replication protein
MFSKAKFYKRRKQLLEYSIDIAILQDKEEESNIVPMIRYLEAVPMGIPDWAYQKGLVA